MSRPIVFLPGVMGSRLYFPHADRFWDPDSQWRMLRWAPVPFVRSDDDNRKDMHVREPAGVVLDPLDDLDADRVSRGWGGVVWSFYKDYLTLLEALAENGRAFALGYDWRQDIRDLGVITAERLRLCLAVTGAEKLWAATHSMGGLVFRAALRPPRTWPPASSGSSTCASRPSGRWCCTAGYSPDWCGRTTAGARWPTGPSGSSSATTGPGSSAT